MRSLQIFILEEEQSELKDKFKRKYKRLYDSVSHNFTPKHSTLVVSMCGNTKDEDATPQNPVEAHDLYLGPANSILNETLPDMDIDWLICTGGYGLINSKTKIHNYQDVIMELSDTTLKSMKDFLGYSNDLAKIVKKGNYKNIIFTLSDTWMCVMDMEQIAEAAGESCKMFGFLTDKRLNDDDFKIPKQFTNIKVNQSWLKKFGSGIISIKEKIVAEYLKYEKEHSGVALDEFIKRKTK